LTQLLYVYTKFFTLPEGVFHNNFFKINYDKNQVHRAYLIYFLRNPKTQKIILEKAGTSTIPDLNHKDFYSVPIALPPTHSEQTAIANALSDTDAFINGLKKLIAKKRAIKHGAMQELLKPKTGWIVKKLGEIGIFKNGINKMSEDFGFGYPFVNLLDVFGKSKILANTHLGLINSNESERKLYDLRKGDVLFIRSSVKPEGVGMTCVIERDLGNTVFSGFIIRYRDNGVLSDEYKEYCFSTNEFRNNLLASSSVSANTNINQTSLKNLSIYYPKPKSEQTQIAQILSDMESEINSLEKKLEKASMLKQGMMQNLLTGKIRLV
jgi:type I restriction enzyme S subunit